MTDTSTTQGSPIRPGPAPMGRVRRAALVVFRVLGVITLLAIAVQFVFAGLGAFDASLDPHRVLGGIIGMLAILMLVPMLIARPGWRWVLLTVLLVVLATVLQPVLAGLGDDTDAWFGGVHALNGLAIMGLTGRLTFGVGHLSGGVRGGNT